jgi:hypothetical protein
MIIGLAIASLLQIGARTVSPVNGVDLATHSIDWVKVQSDALERLVCLGYTVFSR